MKESARIFENEHNKEDSTSYEKVDGSCIYENVLRDKEDILSVVTALFNTNAEGYIERKTSALPTIRVRAECLGKNRDGGLLLYWKTDTAPVNQNIEIRVIGYNSIYTLTFRGCNVSRSIVETALPVEIIIRRNREYRRCLAPTEMLIRFPHPYWPTLISDYKVKDISKQGISLVLDKKIDILKGWKLFEVIVTRGSDKLLEGMATAQHVTRLSSNGTTGRDGDETICGLRIVQDYNSNGRWQKYVDNVLHPNVRQGLADINRYWDLYTESGYFNLSGKNPMDFKSKMTSFNNTTALMSAKPNLGCHAVRVRNGMMEASVTFARHYSRTWQLMNLAKRRDESCCSRTERSLKGRRVLREIYFRAMEPYLRRGGMEFFLTYAKKGSSWTQRIHHDFSPKHTDRGETYMEEVKLIELDTSEGGSSNVTKVEVEEPKIHEVSSFGTFIDERYPCVYKKALDLSQKDILSWRYHQKKRHELYPMRKLIAAKNSECPVAFAVMETIGDSPSLFSLYDNLRIYMLDREFEVDASLKLIEEAKKWFKMAGKERFLYFAETSSDTKILARVGTQVIGDGYMHILSRNVMPSFLEHVYVVSSEWKDD